MAGLYSFKALETFLDKKGFPKLQSQKIEIVRENVIKGVKEGKIKFEKDGIFLFHNNQWQKGYMFIKNPMIDRYGNFPKFHLIKCQTIRNNEFNGKFDDRFDFSNDKSVNLVDYDDFTLEYKNKVLEICIFCKNEIQEQIDYKTTEGFFDLIRH